MEINLSGILINRKTNFCPIKMQHVIIIMLVMLANKSNKTFVSRVRKTTKISLLGETFGSRGIFCFKAVFRKRFSRLFLIFTNY